MADSYNSPRDANNIRLPTEDEVEEEANSGSWLGRMFRVARCERKMFFIMTLMFTLISFIYSIGRVLKDSAVLSRQMPLSINFIKTVVVLPLTVIVIGFIQKCIMKYSFTKVFDGCLIVFSAMFILLGSLLLPFSHLIQPDSNYFKDIFSDGKCVVKGLDSLLPVVLVFSDWTSTLLYVLSEMFGNLILSYFFLTYSNSLTTPGQSARFMPLFYVCSNVALFSSGLVTKYISSKRKEWSFEKAEFVYNTFFVASGFIVLFIYGLKYYLENYVTCKQIFTKKDVKKKGPKTKVGFTEGLKEMMSSKLLLSISLLVMFYGISTNLIESSFKNGLTKGAEKSGSPKKEYAMRFTSTEQIIAAICVVVLLLSPFPKLIQTKGWIWVAIMCPIITIFSAVTVFGLAFYNYPGSNDEPNFFLNGFCAASGEALMKLENYAGVIGVAFMKVAKYASFDISKEALAMRIDSSLRARYKGIFDGIFGKLGKSVGSFLVFALGTAFSTRDIRKLSPIAAAVIMIFVAIWMYCVFYLDRKYKESVDANAPIDIDLFTKKSAVKQEIESSVQTN